MSRKRNTDARGGSFDLETRKNVWQKADSIRGKSPDDYRKDTCGAQIKWSQYGHTDSGQGWEIDHIKPVAKGGEDALSNLQALQWQNNRHKGDDYPKWDCKVTA